MHIDGRIAKLWEAIKMSFVRVFPTPSSVNNFLRHLLHTQYGVPLC